MLVRIVDAEGNDDLVKERNVGKRRAAGTQIGSGMKDKIILSGVACVTFQNR